VECAWAVIKVIEKIREEATTAGFEAKAVEIERGSQDGTAQSALIAISGSGDSRSFVNTWRGTVQWIAAVHFDPNTNARTGS